MSIHSRIVWTEGMFLRPQHFQQHDRFLESLVDGRCRGLRSYDWGFRHLTLDRAQLQYGKIGLKTGDGIFEDGTPFHVSGNDELSLDLPTDVKDSVVYLALPLCYAESPVVDSDANVDRMARYHQHEHEIRDYNSGNESRASVQVGKLHTRLMLEREERSGYLCIGIARIIEVRANNKTVVLDENYIAPALNCIGSGILGDFLKELHGLMHTRGEALSSRVSAPGRSGVSEIADFLLLQMINRYEPLFQHLGATGVLHPEYFFQLAVQLAGELATFYRPDKRAISFPVYRHDDLQACFGPLMEELRQLLSMVLEQNAIQIPLSKPKFGVYAARKPDESLMQNAVFVLAVNAQVSPEMLRIHFPPQVKIGPVEEIQQLVQSALPGITIHALPVAPRQLPYHAGFSYFELSKQSEIWKTMENSGGFAIHIGGNFPGLELEFWAIKKG